MIEENIAPGLEWEMKQDGRMRYSMSIDEDNLTQADELKRQVRVADEDMDLDPIQHGASGCCGPKARIVE